MPPRRYSAKRCKRHSSAHARYTLRVLVKGRNVELRNFGVFEVQIRKPRVGRNPTKPADDVVIPKRAIVKFKAGKELKAALKKLDLSIVEKSKAARARK